MRAAFPRRAAEDHSLISGRLVVPKSMGAAMRRVVMPDPIITIVADRDQSLYSGLIRIHILYHACQGPIFGLGMIEELARHGYKLSAGTLYPLLHRLEKKGLLRSQGRAVWKGS
jgi:hypothetical protein